VLFDTYLTLGLIVIYLNHDSNLPIKQKQLLNNFNKTVLIIKLTGAEMQYDL